MVGALRPAARGKHLLLAGTRASEERLFRDVGVAGAMAPVDGDFLAVVAQNLGENKIDWFLRRGTDYRVELDPASGRVKAHLEVVLRNDAQRKGLPLSVIGNPPDTPVPPGDNRLYLSIYTPWVVDRARIGGAEALLEPATDHRYGGRRCLSSHGREIASSSRGDAGWISPGRQRAPGQGRVAST